MRSSRIIIGGFSLLGGLLLVGCYVGHSDPPVRRQAMTRGTKACPPGSKQDCSRVRYRRVPRPLAVPIVRYPREARKLRLEGSVLLRVTVSPMGSVAEVEVHKSVHPALDRAAAQALRKARFRPALDWQDRPVRATILYRYTFELRR